MKEFLEHLSGKIEGLEYHLQEFPKHSRHEEGRLSALRSVKTYLELSERLQPIKDLSEGLELINLREEKASVSNELHRAKIEISLLLDEKAKLAYDCKNLIEERDSLKRGESQYKELLEALKKQVQVLQTTEPIEVTKLNSLYGEKEELLGKVQDEVQRGLTLKKAFLQYIRKQTGLRSGKAITEIFEDCLARA